jgi:hypothetical protein
MKSSSRLPAVVAAVAVEHVVAGRPGSAHGVAAMDSSATALSRAGL